MMKMIRSLRLLGIVLLLFAANGSFAQLTKKQMKQVGKEAKVLVKEGWRPFPGTLSIELQVEKNYIMSMASDGGMVPKFLMGDGRGINKDYATAKTQAVVFAKQELAGQIQTEVNSIFEQQISEKQINAEEAETKSKIRIDIMSQVRQKLGQTISVMEIYRTIANGDVEVLVRLAYKREELKDEVVNSLKGKL